MKKLSLIWTFDEAASADPVGVDVVEPVVGDRDILAVQHRHAETQLLEPGALHAHIRAAAQGQAGLIVGRIAVEATMDVQSREMDVLRIENRERVLDVLRRNRELEVAELQVRTVADDQVGQGGRRARVRRGDHHAARNVDALKDHARIGARVQENDVARRAEPTAARSSAVVFTATIMTSSPS